VARKPSPSPHRRRLELRTRSFRCARPPLDPIWQPPRGGIPPFSLSTRRGSRRPSPAEERTELVREILPRCRGLPTSWCRVGLAVRAGRCPICAFAKPPPWRLWKQDCAACSSLRACPHTPSAAPVFHVKHPSWPQIPPARMAQAAQRADLTWASTKVRAAGVTPSIREACPSVAGRIAVSFCAASVDSPRTAA